MGSPIGYLMDHIIMNYAIDKALEIPPLEQGSATWFKRNFVTTWPASEFYPARGLPAQTYKVFVDFKTRKRWLPAEFVPTDQTLM